MRGAFFKKPLALRKNVYGKRVRLAARGWPVGCLAPKILPPAGVTPAGFDSAPSQSS